MLIRFNVKNFLSFSARENGESEEFSMIAGKVRSKKEHIYDDGKIKLLKFAAVYGANASGKSNLVKAIDFMRQTVIRRLPDGHTEKYCKALSENRDKPSYFEMELLLDHRYYAYGFEVLLNQSKFLSEWLVELRPNDEETVLFSRDISAGSFRLGGSLGRKGLHEKLELYAEDVKTDDSVLFLSIMNQNKRNLYQSYRSAAIFRTVFLWIRDSLDVNYPNQPISDYAYLTKTDKVQEICSMISAFGTGITDYQMIDIPKEKIFQGINADGRNQLLAQLEKHQAEIRSNRRISSINLVMRSFTDFFIITLDGSNQVRYQTIEFCHEMKDTLFSLAEESDGTVRLLDLLDILITGEGHTYVVDELDRCLHPSLTYKFVETFLKIAAEKEIQLIVTTHESRLMDFDLLRRDEIWFVNKERNGQSSIYSLEEYNARFDQKIDKAYLEGRYGGVPVFSTVFPVGGEET